MDLFAYTLMTLMFAIAGINIIHAVRALVTGKKAGILKVRIDPVPTFIFAVIGIAAIAVSVNRFSSAKEYRDRAMAYERILSADGSGNYQQSSPSSDNRAKYEENIKKLRANADTMSLFGWESVLFGTFEFTLIFGAISYFTEEGIVSNQFKIPEPVTAVLHEGKINVSIAADTHKNKPVWSFKKTPQNLAAFGRFIEWDETEAAEQAPSPDNSNMMT